MRCEPLDAAIRSVSETKALLERLIRSSESFDYLGAKEALSRLEVQVRHLGKLRAELEASRAPRPVNVEVGQFGSDRE